MHVSSGKLWSMRRLADDNGRFKMVAADQRPPIFSLVRQRKGGEATYDEVASVKEALVDALSPAASAVLLDPIWAFPRCAARLDPRKGLLVTLEDHAFEETAGGRLSREIGDWSVGKIRRLGAEGVKVLAWYRPDGDPGVCERQQEFVERVGRACAANDICFLLELLVYPLPNEAGQTKDYIEHSAKRPELVIRSLEAFADPRFGVDIFKLESPLAAADVPEPGTDGAAECQRWFDALGRAATRPWVMLSAGAEMQQFRRILSYAYRAGASGYLAGRAIWWKAAQAFPDLAAVDAGLRGEGLAYMNEINVLTDAMAKPWTDHPAFGDGIGLEYGGPDFYRQYKDFPRS